MIFFLHQPYNAPMYMSSIGKKSDKEAWKIRGKKSKKANTYYSYSWLYVWNIYKEQ